MAAAIRFRRIALHACLPCPCPTSHFPAIPKSVFPLLQSKKASFSFKALRVRSNNLLRSRVFCSSVDACNCSSSAVTSPTPSGSPFFPVSPTPSPGVDTLRDAANSLDIRVGRILKAWRHPEADSLYVEEVDVGEAEPRTICSALVQFVPLEELQDRYVIVLANLKPRNMRGIKSNGMLLAASDTQHKHVELLLPPAGSAPGERIWFGLEEEKHEHHEAATPNQVLKKKIWESVQPHLKTTSSCVAVLMEHPMRTSTGVIVCKSLKNANIS